MKKLIRSILLTVAFIASTTSAIVEEEATIIVEDENYEGNYQGVSKVYETMDFFFFQSFFDTLSKKFFPPLLSNLSFFEFP